MTHGFAETSFSIGIRHEGTKEYLKRTVLHMTTIKLHQTSRISSCRISFVVVIGAVAVVAAVCVVHFQSRNESLEFRMLLSADHGLMQSSPPQRPTSSSTILPSTRRQEFSSFSQPSPCKLACLDLDDIVLQDETCSTFYPKRYFEQGPGQPYLPMYHHDVNKTYSKHETKWSLLPGRMVVFTRKSGRKSKMLETNPNTNSSPDHRCWHKMVFLHLHKCGGSTMNSLVRGHNPKVFPYSIKPWLHFQEARWSTTSFNQRTMYIMTSVADNPDTMMAFSFVRDPVTRFLSGVGQILVNQDFNELFPKCVVTQARGNSALRHDATTTNAMLGCVITTLQTQKSFLNEHLEPQTFELYRGVRELDIPVLLFNLPTLSELVRVAGMNATRRRSVVEQGSFIDRHWLKGDVLTPVLIERICKLYDMDVQLLYTTGVAPTKCPLPTATRLG